MMGRPRRKDLIDALAHTVASLHPNQLDAWAIGAETLLDADYDLALLVLGWLHVYGPDTVARAADWLGLDPADIVDPSPCADCDRNVIYIDESNYMLLDAVWTAAGLGDGLLCVACLEDRLGRRLTAADFDHTLPMTHLDDLPRSPELQARIDAR